MWLAKWRYSLGCILLQVAPGNIASIPIPFSTCKVDPLAKIIMVTHH